MKEQEGGGICPCVALALALLAAGAVCQQSRRFPLPIDNLAVSRTSLWVASGNCLYELEPRLGETLWSNCSTEHNRVNKLLLPFGDGDERLLTCWTLPQGVCYEPNDTRVFGKALVSCLPRGSAVGKMFKSNGQWSLVVATTHKLNDSSDTCIPAKSDARTAISIATENERVTEDDVRLKVDEKTFLTFVDAFLWKQKGRFFFPYYHYYDQGKEPLMVVLEANDIVITPHGQTKLRCATSRNRILSSSWIELSEERAFWVGIFSSAEAGRSPTSSALCIFNLTQVMDDAEGGFSRNIGYQIKDTSTTATPSLHNSPSLSHSDLVSVYATIVLKKIVLFLGTGNGQLLKIILDDNMKPNCPDILYEIEEETAIFHKLALDPVDKDYIYLPSSETVRRVQVANCNKYVSCHDCLSAMDPHCGWCYLNKSCTLQGECPYSNDSRNWANISYGTDKCLKIYVSELNRGEEQHIQKGLKHGGKTKTDDEITVFAEISVTASGNFSGLSKGQSRCIVMNAKTNKLLCENETSNNMNCSCHVKRADLTGKVEVLLISGSQNLSDVFELNYCSLYKTCSSCDHAGCTWYARDNRCDSTTGTCKQKIDCSVVINASNENTTTQRTKPMNISSIQPLQISVLGKSEVIVRGENLTATNILMVITGTSSCKPDEIPSSEVNGTHMKFCLPPSRKEVKSVCIKADGFTCSPPMTLHYVSLPKCYAITPHISWISGGRNITISGSNLNFTDEVLVLDGQGINLSKFTCHGESTKCSFTTPAITSEKWPKTANIILEIEKRQILCEKLLYDPDPTFIRYDLITDMEPDLELKIHKKNDSLNISGSEIKVFLSHMSDKNWRNTSFVVHNITKATNNIIIHCRGKWENNGTHKFDKSNVKVYIKVGNLVHEVPNKSVNYTYLYILLLIPFVIAIAFFVTQRKSRQLNRRLNEHLELLECELRKEIREGFVELQMEKLDVVDSFGTIPFLDYRHFVLRAFFPESGGFSSIIIEDNSELLNNPGHKDKSVTALYALICNKNFLITLIHTLEKQKTFSVKDRCLFASYLTIALQTKLVYLTHILEVLTKDLMEQSSNIQPKLMLRRTESVVEKLLTNWMSVCLAGFLRETVGEPFYLLITTLNQRIIKGPVDVITCKALYTLNEDWLLWQVPEFNTVALNVVFEKIPENEAEDTTQNIQVNVLDCDTIGQTKEKILQAFVNKNGSLYGLQLSEMDLALLQSAAQEKQLLDIDSSSVILEDGITKLNTIGHYEISDGATIKVFKKTTDLSDGEYSDNYCHLILPDSEGAKDAQGAKHKGKQKFKVKEMYLTKLLSTKVMPGFYSKEKEEWQLYKLQSRTWFPYP